MLAEGEAIGAVNLYDSQPRNWSAEDLRIATIFASIATGYLTHASAAQQQQRTAEQLQQAMNTRLIIEQAKGVLAISERSPSMKRSRPSASTPGTTTPASTMFAAP